MRIIWLVGIVFRKGEMEGGGDGKKNKIFKIGDS